MSPPLPRLFCDGSTFIFFVAEKESHTLSIRKGINRSQATFYQTTSQGESGEGARSKERDLSREILLASIRNCAYEIHNREMGDVESLGGGGGLGGNPQRKNSVFPIGLKFSRVSGERITERGGGYRCEDAWETWFPPLDCAREGVRFLRHLKKHLRFL